MNKQEYREYLQTPDWKGRRDEKLFAVGYRCERCGYDGIDRPLDVHHLTYERLGHEREGDLIVLCRTCHEKAHSPEGRALDRKVQDVVDQIRREVTANGGTA